jgi:small basic protein (TIGR04137 family)
MFIDDEPTPQVELHRSDMRDTSVEKPRVRATFTTHFHRNLFMSQHRSLKGASTIAAKRNVLKRFERVELLKKRGQWKEGRKVLGLPKTKPDV